MEFNDNSREYIRHMVNREDYLYRRRKQTLIIIFASLVLFPLVFSVLQLVPAYQSILSKEEQILDAQLEGMKKIPNIEKNLSQLESQISILSTESIEARLSKIENAIHAGDINSDEIGSFIDLQNDITTLKTYMFRDPKELIELKILQKDYRELADNQSQYATKEALRSEVSTFQTILTISLSFFGLLFTVVFGSWWFIGKRTAETSQPTRPVNKSSAPKDNEEEA